jgi:hypothetical protein
MSEPNGAEIIDEPIERQLVKVRYVDESTGEVSGREYTYFSEEPLNIGDLVTAPIKDTIGKAKVTAVDVPESEIATFKDKVKTIPSGSVIHLPGSVVNLRSDEQIIEGPTPEIYEKTDALLVVEQKADDMSVQVFMVEEITTPEVHQDAEKWLSVIRIQLQDLEKARVSDVKKPNEYVKWINSKYKEKGDLLRRMEQHCLKVIGVFRQKERAKADAEQARLDAIAKRTFENRQAEEAAARRKEADAREAEEAARKAGDLEAAEKSRREAQKAAAEAERKASVVPVPFASKVETIATTTDTGSSKNIWGTEWDFEIVKPDLVPREFCEPDEKRIRQYAKLMMAEAVMAGVRFFEKDKVQVRRR